MTDLESSAGALAEKRIVFVLAGEVLGGAERGALDLACELRDRYGAAVGVVALDDREGRARLLAAERGVPWTCVRVHWDGSRFHKVVALARFVRAVRRMHPDVLISSTNRPNVVCGLTWRATGAAVAVWTQCDVNGTTRFSQRVFRRALRRVSIVVISAFHGRDWLIAEFGPDPRRVHVVRGRVMLSAPRETRRAWREHLELRQSDFVACMVAHLHAGKDHATLLRAWRIVVDELEPSRTRPVALLVGRDAGNRGPVEALVVDLGLGESVRFLGEVDDVSGVLGASDLAVFCSHRELLPRGVLEPMAAGLPVAGVDIPGVREAVGPSGAQFLAPPGDAEGLAREILRLARDPALRERVGRANADLERLRLAAGATSGAYARLLRSALPDPR